MIADLTFGNPDARGVRRSRFVPRASIPLAAACLIASGLRESMRELLGAPCDVTLGEPSTIDAHAWRALTQDAHCYLTRGRATDVVLVIGNADARRFVMRAFGESGPLAPGVLSTLERQALERFAARCEGAFDPLCAERRAPSRAITGNEIPSCVAYFDVRVRAPIALTLGVGIVRALPDPGPNGALAPSALAHVPIDVHAEFARGSIEAGRLLDLRVGDVVRMNTKVASPAVLKVGPNVIATGACGIRGAFQAFHIDESRGVAP